MRNLWKRMGVAVILLAVIVLAGGYAVYHGIILLNHPSRGRYPVRGVDVSHYQGEIDWPVLAGEGIDFAYIKATEGSSHVDDQFDKNWSGAQQTGLRIGAYHFFSFDSPAETQLEHFIDVVPEFPEMLPPVVDFEYYGDKRSNPPKTEEAREQLRAMLEGLKAHYGVTPVIYATEEVWERYLEGCFDEYPLWIRNVVSRPDTGDQNWVFWQYTNRERLNGYSGEEQYIDMNVFGGDENEWEFWSRNYEKGWNYAVNWGSFRRGPQYSYDGRYVAVQDVVYQEEIGLHSVRVTIQEPATGETVDSFLADRSMDFWGICWEPGTYRIWTQSGDVGLRCYEPEEGTWKYKAGEEQPDTVISKYDTIHDKLGENMQQKKK